MPSLPMPVTAAASIAGALVVSCFVAAPALAQDAWPDVMSALPEGTHAALVTKRLGDVEKHWNEFMTAIDLGAMVENFSPLDFLASHLGLDASALDREGAMAVAAVGAANWEEGQETPILALLPVKNYTQWLVSLGVTPPANAQADAIQEITLAAVAEGHGDEAGGPWFARPAANGKYAVISPDRAVIEGYTPDAKAPEAFSKRAGDVGASLAQRCDIVALLNFEALEDMKESFAQGLTQGMSEQMAQMSAMGMAVPTAEQMEALNAAFVDLLIDETSAGVAGLRFGERGIAFDLALQTREGSEMGKLLPGVGEPRNLLNKFQDQPFLMAMTIDMKAVKVDQLVDLLKRRLNLEALLGAAAEAGTADAGGGAGAAPGGQGRIPGLMPSADFWTHADGMAMVIYPSPAGMMGGLMSQSVSFLSGDPDQIRQSVREAMEEMNGSEANGIAMTTEYTAGFKEIGGVMVDAYAVKMKVPADQMQVQQQIAMIYGPAGLRGYLIPVEDGVLQTTSRNDQLALAALNAYKAEDGTGLGANKTLAAVDQLLPASPMLRGYIGMGAISSQIAPMAAMMGMQLDAEELAALPPIVMGASVEDGGVVGSFAVPAPIIKAVAEIAMQMQGAMGEGDEGMEEEDPPVF